jgi:hypothetical protein
LALAERTAIRCEGIVQVAYARIFALYSWE